MPKERQTCTECSMRRQKCDRNLPCGRCIRRGEADKCTREWPEGGYDARVHRTYPKPDQNATTGSNTNNNSPDTSNMTASDLTLHPSLHTSPVTGPSPEVPSSAYLTPRPDAAGSVTGVDNASSTIEFLTWGATKLSDYDLKALELLREPHNSNSFKDAISDWDFSNGFGGTGAAQISFLQLLLPPRGQILQLVEYHLTSILWYHACFHGPTFYLELQEVFKAPNGLQIRDMDLRWAALLFSVMAASMTCASDQMISNWGFSKQEKPKLTRQWYKATVTCLNLADYMWRQHIYSLEAILTLTMSAHILGFSNTQNTLLGAALKIGQGLGLQRLGPEDDSTFNNEPNQAMTPAQKERVIKREIGRRIWAQLCIQDWFSIPFSEMYSIQKLHMTTLKPVNLDNLTFERVPDNTPTQTSFECILYDIATLMPQMHDAIVSSSTLYTKYDQVLDYDAKMRKLATDLLPGYFSMRETIDPKWPMWIPWARRSLTICFAHKIIMIHRSFLGKSFTEPTFEFTRRTCMAAAKTILKEARQAYDEEGPMLWIDQAFMVAAGITLSLDIFHRKSEEPEFDEHRKLVENTVSMLRKFDNSMIALRGIRLLSSLLAEQARLSANQTLESYRKRTLDGHSENGQPKKQKFDIPKFVETFVGNDSFTNSLNTRTRNGDQPEQMVESNDQNASALPDFGCSTDFGYETFEQLFPPHTGISNSFLFEDLLNFDL